MISRCRVPSGRTTDTVRLLPRIVLAVIVAFLGSIVPTEAVSALSPSVGHFDLIAETNPETQQIRIAGWALTSDYPTTPLGVRVLVDGAVYPMPSPGYFYANTYRPDVGAAYPGYGNWHGFHAWVTVPFGSHQVCVQAQNTGVYTTLTNCHSYNMTLDTMYPSTATTAQCSDSGMWDGGWLACQTDDTDLTYCFETSATLKLWHGVNTTMTYSYDTTDLNKDEETACDYGGSTETDIVWRELSSLPSGSLGFVHCDDATHRWYAINTMRASTRISSS